MPTWCNNIMYWSFFSSTCFGHMRLKHVELKKLQYITLLHQVGISLYFKLPVFGRWTEWTAWGQIFVEWEPQNSKQSLLASCWTLHLADGVDSLRSQQSCQPQRSGITTSLTVTERCSCLLAIYFICVN